MPWMKKLQQQRKIIHGSLLHLRRCTKQLVKWVYKVKKNSKGEVERYRARLVVKGFSQLPGIDYDEVFVPVARLETIRLIISLAAQNRWKIHQMNVKSAFLNGYLDEVYVKQPLGYVMPPILNKSRVLTF